MNLLYEIKKKIFLKEKPFVKMHTQKHTQIIHKSFINYTILQ